MSCIKERCQCRDTQLCTYTRKLASVGIPYAYVRAARVIKLDHARTALLLVELKIKLPFFASTETAKVGQIAVDISCLEKFLRPG